MTSFPPSATGTPQQQQQLLQSERDPAMVVMAIMTRRQQHVLLKCIYISVFNGCIHASSSLFYYYCKIDKNSINYHRNSINDVLPVQDVCSSNVQHPLNCMTKELVHLEQSVVIFAIPQDSSKMLASAVVDHGPFPSVTDDNSLPYISACIRYCLHCCQHVLLSKTLKTPK